MMGTCKNIEIHIKKQQHRHDSPDFLAQDIAKHALFLTSDKPSASDQSTTRVEESSSDAPLSKSPKSLSFTATCNKNKLYVTFELFTHET